MYPIHIGISPLFLNLWLLLHYALKILLWRCIMSNLSFAKIVQDFFLNRLINQKNVSPQTISSYRDTIRLLLHYLYCQNKKAPSCLTIADIDASVILKFLNYLEKERNNSITSRNARLSAIRSF